MSDTKSAPVPGGPTFLPAPQRPRHSRDRTYWSVLVVAIVTLMGIHHIGVVPAGISLSQPWTPRAGPEQESSPWPAIKPTRSLKWHRCYDGQYDCARLDVPMDWLEPSDDHRVVLAVIRLRAKNMTDYRGPVFFNPGGPGGSGIWSMLDHGEYIQQVVGTNHDVITFDPRGVGASIPRIQCWSSDQQRTFWDLTDVGVSDSHPGVVYDEYFRALATSQHCEATMTPPQLGSSSSSSSILRHISTASHARDMLEILVQTGHQRLRYWGFSYGTVLGATFAAMYPDRVERMVNDGNVDLEEWHHHTRINFPRDADRVLDAFYTFCARAGPDRCALYSPTPSQIEHRLRTLLESLRHNPVLIPATAASSPIDPGPDMPEIVTYSKLRRLLASALYQPLYKFPELARVLAALERRDGLPFFDMVGADSPPLASFCAALPVEPSVPLSNVVEGTADAFPAIMCADSEGWTGTAGEFARLAEEIRGISYAVGAVDSSPRSACVGRRVRPKFRHDGPFEEKTNFPILFIANMADNVTPLVSARNNSQGFAGSVVLVQNSYGHTTLSTPSTCTARRIRAYFQRGELPLDGDECEPDYVPFDRWELPSQVVADAGGVADEEGELSRAIRLLSKRASVGLGRTGI